MTMTATDAERQRYPQGHRLLPERRLQTCQAGGLSCPPLGRSNLRPGFSKSFPIRFHDVSVLQWQCRTMTSSTLTPHIWCVLACYTMMQLPRRNAFRCC